MASGGVSDFLASRDNKTGSSPATHEAGAGGDKGRVAQELGANLELGELEQLTITNDNESSYDVSQFDTMFWEFLKYLD